ncbi:hypothetical protein [Psychrobacter ciconiae]|uniref:hypothetical protein n=1 Tax=Psychrobacter ciconiae TaxID=1553449 RepID=UPI001918E584|nr:hypothetical protein [Psychrobacter ciconiae]
MGTAMQSKIIGAKALAVSLAVGLAAMGCSKTEKTEVEDAPVVDNSGVAPAIACQDPLVQDRLKNALKNSIYQRSQSLASSYGSEADVSLDLSLVRSKVNSTGISINNITMTQASTNNGINTCQAAVSIAPTSEDVFLANQLNTDNGHPTVQSQVAQDNLRMTNNSIIDDALTYIVGMQSGQVQVRVVGNPPLLTAVSDVIASAMLKSELDKQTSSLPPLTSSQETRPVVRAPKPVAPAQPSQPAKPAQPAKPVQPAKPAQPLSSSNNDSGSQSGLSVQESSSISAATDKNSKPSSSSESNNANKPAAKPQPATPKDDSIDMVIIEENSTY